MLWTPESAYYEEPFKLEELKKPSNQAPGKVKVIPVPLLTSFKHLTDANNLDEVF